MWHKDDFYIIAEIGVNHNGDIEIAKKLIDGAKACGANAVKFQTFLADTLVTKDAPKAEYQSENDPSDDNQYDMLKKLELSREAHCELKDYAENAGIQFLSTPFDVSDIDFLDELGVDGFKVSSGDLNNVGFMAHMARKNKPMIISTGMSSLEEVEKTVQVIADHGNPPLAILHCVSNYPAALEDCNLRAMGTIAQAFGKPTGWSDHTTGNVSAVVAVLMGAGIVEKHITLDQSMEGPDHKASMDIAQFKAYVAALRQAWQDFKAGNVTLSAEAEIALGDGVKVPRPVELPVKAIAQKSLFAMVDICAGEAVTEAHIKAMRPAEQGISAADYFELLGAVATQDIAAHTPLGWDMFEAMPAQKMA